MMDTTQWFSVAQAGIIPPILIGVAIWNSDKIKSEDGANLMYGHISHTAEQPSQSKISDVIDTFLKSRFSSNGFMGFLLNVFILTCISLAIMLAVYTSQTSGFYSYLTSPGFLAQFFGNGFFVTFVTNCLILSAYPLVLERFVREGLTNAFLLMLMDQLLKIGLFLLLTAVSYIWFAEFKGAFNGSKELALKAIPDTVLLGLKFGNLTSVYIYSLLLSSFPLFIVLTIKLMANSDRARSTVQRILFWLPFKNKPLRLVGSVFAAFCGLFALLVSILLNMLSS